MSLNLKNADAGHQYRRILGFVNHPNRFFYGNEQESIRQDQLFTIAAKIAQVGFVERYHQDKKWREVVPVDFRNRVTREKYSMFHARASESGQILLTPIP